MNNTKQNILDEAKALFARTGYEGFSIRTLANQTGTGLSSIYHFFDSKDELLKEIFDDVGKSLGQSRARLPQSETASAMLKARIEFQFLHIEEVVFVLKYYLHFRDLFSEHEEGHLPVKAYLHIQEVLDFGLETGEFTINSSQIEQESKVVAHAINGFLLEYYPAIPVDEDLDSIVSSIHSFLIRSLTNKEAVMS